jgi:microcystin-dependent protein
MGQPFIGEIRMFAGTFAPAGWAFCDGQIMPIAENEGLFQLIGTTYGGDGLSTFALPNLQSRVAIHSGQGPGLANHPIGEMAGAEVVTLTPQQVPVHNHALAVSTAAGNVNNAQGSVLADGPAQAYIEAAPNNAMAPAAVTPAGGSQPHDNRMPFLAVSFIISLYGIYPSTT